MSAPLISPLPDAPTPADSPSVFNTKSFAFVSALATMRSQMNALAVWMQVTASGKTVVTQTGTTVTLSLANAGEYIRFTNNGSKTIYVPIGSAIPNGIIWYLYNLGEALLSLTAEDGVTINNISGISQNSAGMLIKVADGVYDFIPFAGEGGGGGMTNPMTAVGDMIVGGTSGAPARRAAGSELQVLTIVDGVPTWSNSQSVIETEFTVTPGSSYAWEGFPVGPGHGDGYFAGGGTINNGAFYDGTGIIPGEVLDYTGIGLGFVTDNDSGNVFFILVLPGVTGEEVIEVSGIPYYGSRTTTTATFGYNADIGQNVFAWDLGEDSFIPSAWYESPAEEMRIRRFS